MLPHCTWVGQTVNLNNYHTLVFAERWTPSM
jgi:hypothetical protein